MRTVWKFPVEITEHAEVEMPAAAQVLHVGAQGDTLCVWALVDPDAARETRVFHVHGTGHEVGPLEGEHLGSAATHGGALVWHVFGRRQ